MQAELLFATEAKPGNSLAQRETVDPAHGPMSDASKASSGYPLRGFGPRAQPSYVNRLAAAPPSNGHLLLQLQRQYGNRHVQRVLGLMPEKTSQSAVDEDVSGLSMPTNSAYFVQRERDRTDQLVALDSSSISVDEDLFVDDEESGASTTVTGSSIPGIVQRAPDDSDIPPPPPPFPSVYDWAFDVFDDAGSLYGLTCEDRRERGFFVMWNQGSNKSFAGPTAIGDPATGCSSARIQLGNKPADRPPIFPVGWFHTHPPANPGCKKLGVGPSDTDKNTSRDSGLPGMVLDSQTPTSGCKNSGYFFFGPTTRT